MVRKLAIREQPEFISWFTERLPDVDGESERRENEVSVIQQADCKTCCDVNGSVVTFL